MSKLYIVILLFVSLFNNNAFSFIPDDEELYSIISVGNAKLKKIRVGFILPDKFITSKKEVSVPNRLYTKIDLAKQVLNNDFSFYKYNLELSKITSKKKYVFSNLPIIFEELALNYDFIVLLDNQLTSSFKKIKKIVNAKSIDAEVLSEAFLNFYVISIADKKVLIKEKLKVSGFLTRNKIHQLNDKIYQSIAQKKSVFNSEIIFVSDRTSKNGKTYKELYIMDFDGSNVKRLTFFNSTVVSPSFSPDNSKILYTLISARPSRSIKNVDLYIYDRKKKTHRLVSSKRGLNSGAIFSSKKNEIILTMSYSGSANLYKMNLNSSKLKLITRHFASDVDASLSGDGSLLAFLSNRSGKADIYTSDPAGIEKNVIRRSFVGKFNAAPRFSPVRKELVFSSWLDNRFDIFRLNVLTSEVFRLTKNFGSNEDANYSTDGEFVVFSSLRVKSAKSAVKNLYIMNRDGQLISPITQDLGKCQTPDWSN
jgi:TolB protein